mgnify:CR=1 FL=1
MLITVLKYVAINRHTVTNTTHVSHTPAPRGGGMALLLILESSEAVAAPPMQHMGTGWGFLLCDRFTSIRSGADLGYLPNLMII